MSYEIWDKIYFFIISMIGQLMVVMFLFYSGYGIIEQFKNRDNYLDGFIKNRFLKTLFNFDIAVMLFVLLAISLDKGYSLPQILLSFTAWESIGNSNWFVFDILILYLIGYASLILVKKYGWSLKRALVIIFLLCCGFILLLAIIKKDTWWYNTIFAFPMGMLYSVYKTRIEHEVRGNRYWYVLIFTFLIFTSLYLSNSIPLYLFAAGIFPILVALITMKIKIGNKVLEWLGINCFTIYILQRIPMTIYTEMGLNNNGLLFAIVVIPTTLLIASLFTIFINKITPKVFLKNSKKLQAYN